MPYTIEVHRHRFAAWCASTAARSSTSCRFPVEIGVQLVEQSGLMALGEGWHALPDAADVFDERHRELRTTLVALARTRLSLSMTFTHGVAAKMINCYLKPIYVCGAPTEAEATRHEDKQKLIHPPIDRLLLTELYRSNAGGLGPQWRHYRDIGWSNFTSEQYESVIGLIRLTVGTGPLWRIEEHWGGYQ